MVSHRFSNIYIACDVWRGRYLRLPTLPTLSRRIKWREIKILQKPNRIGRSRPLHLPPIFSCPWLCKSNAVEKSLLAPPCDLCFCASRIRAISRLPNLSGPGAKNGARLKSRISFVFVPWIISLGNGRLWGLGSFAGCVGVKRELTKRIRPKAKANPYR